MPKLGTLTFVFFLILLLLQLPLVLLYTTITTTTTTTSVEGNLIDLSEKSHFTSCYILPPTPCACSKGHGLLIVLTAGGDLAGKLSEKRKAVRRSAKPWLEKWLKCPSIKRSLESGSGLSSKTGLLGGPLRIMNYALAGGRAMALDTLDPVLKFGIEHISESSNPTSLNPWSGKLVMLDEAHNLTTPCKRLRKL